MSLRGLTPAIVDKVRRLVRRSAELAASVEDEIKAEGELLRKALALHDFLSSSPLTTPQLVTLEAKIADAIRTKTDPKVVSIETDGAITTTSQPTPGLRLKVSDLALYLVPAPAGEFNMGKDAFRPGFRVVAHTVKIAQPFWIGATEVTLAQFEALGMEPSRTMPHATPQTPINLINWHEATQWCHALTARERSAGRLPEGYIYALPSEAQWEYA